MAPSYADKADGAVMRECFDLGKRGGQKPHELRVRHFTGRHRKFTVLDTAATADMPDRQIVGRIREDHVGPIKPQEPLIGGALQRRAAEQAVLFELPKVSRFGNGREAERLRKRVGAVVVRVAIREDKVDLCGVKANCRKIVIYIQLTQELQLAYKRFWVPRSEFGEPIVGQDKGAFLWFAQMTGADRKDSLKAELSGR